MYSTIKWYCLILITVFVVCDEVLRFPWQLTLLWVCITKVCLMFFYMVHAHITTINNITNPTMYLMYKDGTLMDEHMHHHTRIRISTCVYCITSGTLTDDDINTIYTMLPTTRGTKDFGHLHLV